MLSSLILLSVVSLVICEYEVGFKYNYFYDAESAFITTKVDSPSLTSSFKFSSIASITCLSGDEHGFQFKLEFTGIHLIQRDTKGIKVADQSGLKIDATFNKQFIFTILRTGAVGEVKHFEGESEDVLNIKIGVVSQFITLGDNETDGGPTETLDNQGMYLSHWKREKKRGTDGVVELTRRYTDKDFIHHHDKNVTENSFLLDAFERKKMRSGVVTTSAAEQTLFIAGKEFRKRGRRLGDDLEKRRKFELGNNLDDELYNGTEISTASKSSLQQINRVSTTLNRRNKHASSSNMGSNAESSLMKEVPYFNRDFYADRVKNDEAGSESSSSAFASLARRKKNIDINLNICGKKDDDGEEEEESSGAEDEDEDEEDDPCLLGPGKCDETICILGDCEEEEDEEKSFWEQFFDEDAWDQYLDPDEEADWEVYWEPESNRAANVEKPKYSLFPSPTPASLTLEDILRMNAENPDPRMVPYDPSRSVVDWEEKRHERIHKSLGGILDAIYPKNPPKKKCPKMSSIFDKEPKDYTFGIKPPPKLKLPSIPKTIKIPGLDYVPKELQPPEITLPDIKIPGYPGSRLSASQSQSHSSVSSTSLLSPSAFDSPLTESNKDFKITCPEGQGFSTCYEIGSGKGGGNEDFGAYAQFVIYSASQKTGGETGQCIDNCNFLLDFDTGAYLKILGFNLTIFHIAACAYRVNNYPGRAYVDLVLFNIPFGCKFDDGACGGFVITICEFKIPIPNCGVSFKRSFFIFDIEFVAGLVFYFHLKLNFEVCPTEGSVRSTLPPTFGLSVGITATLRILKSKLGLEITASTEIALVPEFILNLSRNEIVFALRLVWNPIALKLRIDIKICILILPCIAAGYTIIDWMAKPLVFTFFEYHWRLPWTSNDAYGGTTSLENNTGSGIKTGMGNSGEYGEAGIGAGAGSEARAGPKDNIPVREVLDALLDHSDAGATPDADTNMDAGAGAVGGV